MASPSARGSFPWLALGGAALVALLAVAVFVLMDEPPDPAVRPLPVSIAPPEDRPGTLLPEAPVPDAQMPAVATPIPGVTSEPVAPHDDGLLPDPILVHGWVEDVAQRRLPDVEVNLFDDLGEYLDTTTTDEDGTFAFRWDEALLPGWGVGTEPDFLSDGDEAENVVPAFAVQARAAIPGEPPVQVRLVLAPAPRLRGLVFDAETRDPIALANVEAVSTARAWVDEWQDTFTGDDGGFELELTDLPAQGLLVRITDDEGRGATLGPLDLGPGEVRFVEVPLSGARGLEGVVLSSERTPVDGAEVLLLPLHEYYDDGDAWDITGEEGTWLIEPLSVPDDKIWLYVQADGYGPTVQHPPTAAHPVEVQLGPPVVLRGRLTEVGTGAPVPDAVVRAILRGPGGLYEDAEDIEYSDDEGAFELELAYVPPDSAELFVESDAHVRFRRVLSELAPTHVPQAAYDVVVELQPIPNP